MRCVTTTMTRSRRRSARSTAVAARAHSDRTYPAFVSDESGAQIRGDTMRLPLRPRPRQRQQQRQQLRPQLRLRTRHRSRQRSRQRAGRRSRPRLTLLGAFGAALALTLAPTPAASASMWKPSMWKPRFEHYVALGDSYTSGPLIPVPKLTPPLGCVRSMLNYPTLLAVKARAGSFDDVSCGG